MSIFHSGEVEGLPESDSKGHENIDTEKLLRKEKRWEGTGWGVFFYLSFIFFCFG